MLIVGQKRVLARLYLPYPRDAWINQRKSRAELPVDGIEEGNALASPGVFLNE